MTRQIIDFLLDTSVVTSETTLFASLASIVIALGLFIFLVYREIRKDEAILYDEDDDEIF